MSPAHNVATVNISDGAGGFITINQSDFDPGVQELYVAPSVAPVDQEPVIEEEPALKPALRKRT